MFQKGPGEGYGAAKEKALAIKPDLSCKESRNGGIRHYRICEGDKDLGCAAASARDAWNRILDRLETDN